jgi:hypothetical protein
MVVCEIAEFVVDHLHDRGSARDEVLDQRLSPAREHLACTTRWQDTSSVPRQPSTLHRFCVHDTLASGDRPSKRRSRKALKLLRGSAMSVTVAVGLKALSGKAPDSNLPTASQRHHASLPSLFL